MGEKKFYLLVPIIALVISTIIYVSFASSFNSLGPESSRFQTILHEYDTLPAESLLFLGDSQIQDGIDCNLIDQIVEEKCFNFGLAGLVPVQLALQKELIISSSPKTVVIGTSAAFYDESMNKNDDLFMVMSQFKKISYDAFLLTKVTEQEKKLLTMNIFQRSLYKRKFILPFYTSLFKQVFFSQEVYPNIINNFKNPHFFIHQQPIETLISKLEDPNITQIFEIEKSQKREREAFHYLIAEMKKEGIHVVVIHMPTHPLVWQTVPSSSQETFQQYLEELSDVLNFTLINTQEDFLPEHFTDLTHLNRAGSEHLSKKIVEGEYNIIQ